MPKSQPREQPFSFSFPHRLCFSIPINCRCGKLIHSGGAEIQFPQPLRHGAEHHLHNGLRRRNVIFQAIADKTASGAGIIYSTTANFNSLVLGGKDVTNVAAERITDATTTIPQSVWDQNNCWKLELTPDDAETVYHARAYVTVDGKPVYGDIQDVKLSELESGVSMVANLGTFDPTSGLDDVLASLTEGMHTVTYYPNGGVGATLTQAFKDSSVALKSNVFTRDGFRFIGWSTEPKAQPTYKDGESITLTGNIALYAQWTVSHTHNWGALTYVWSADNTSVTATRVCQSDSTHVETETVTATSAVTMAATCTTDGVRTWTSAAFANSAFTVQTKTETITATRHSWGAPTYVWSADNTSVTATRVCANDSSHTETETETATSSVTTAATCTTRAAACSR